MSDRLLQLADRARERASRAAKRAERANAEFRQIMDMIPVGQPILRGHHSQKRHEATLARADRRMREYVSEGAAAEQALAAAKHHEARAAALSHAGATSPEPYQVGDVVVARFTNSGRVLEITGEIVDRTLNAWKVYAPSPYPNDDRVQAWPIPCAGRPRYSPNNSVIRYKEADDD